MSPSQEIKQMWNLMKHFELGVISGAFRLKMDRWHRDARKTMCSEPRHSPFVIILERNQQYNRNIMQYISQTDANRKEHFSFLVTEEKTEITVHQSSSPVKHFTNTILVQP